MTEMIERVAKAIANQQGYYPTLNYAAWWDQARVAIEAMRDPTAEMMDAGNAAREASISAEVNTLATWHGMLEAALSSGQGS